MGARLAHFYFMLIILYVNFNSSTLNLTFYKIDDILYTSSEGNTLKPERNYSMKIWAVREEVLIDGKWEENNEGYYSSREDAESAIVAYLIGIHSIETIISAYNLRIEDDCGFLMTLPETEWVHSSRYDVSPWELNEKLGC